MHGRVSAIGGRRAPAVVRWLWVAAGCVTLGGGAGGGRGGHGTDVNRKAVGNPCGCQVRVCRESRGAVTAHATGWAGSRYVLQMLAPRGWAGFGAVAEPGALAIYWFDSVRCSFLLRVTSDSTCVDPMLVPLLTM